MSFSIVIPTFNQEEALRAQLPILLQEEGVDDVVVVNMDSEDDTKKLLEGFELVFPHLSHTYTPHSSRHKDIRQLAIMLGCRAALHQQILLTMVDESGKNPLLSLPALRIEAIFQKMLQKKRKYCFLLRPYSIWKFRTMWHRLLGINHFFQYLTSRKSKRAFYRFQILLIK